MTGVRCTRSRWRFAAFLLLLSVVVAACGSTGQFELVDAAEAAELVDASADGLVVLDIRTPEEFDAGHIDASTMIDFYEPDFEAQLDGLDKTTPYLVYCRSGNRSAQAIETMKALGFEEVYELDGGVVAWAEAGLPLTVS